MPRRGKGELLRYKVRNPGEHTKFLLPIPIKLKQWIERYCYDNDYPSRTRFILEAIMEKKERVQKKGYSQKPSSEYPKEFLL